MYSPRFYYVYIMTNRSKTLYTGVTGHLERASSNTNKASRANSPPVTRSIAWSTSRRFDDIHAAIAREKQIKGLAAPQERWL